MFLIQVLDTFAKKVFHETDGLILSPEDEVIRYRVVNA